ncbi:MAG: caspase family protein [Alphaproteobacteria bacterium]
MKRLVSLVGLVAAVLAVLVGASQAQMSSFRMRAQTNVIERAITKNVERLFRPKLVISQGATGPVTALAMSRDEHYLISAVGDNSVRVWDLFVGREVARLRGHTGRILAIAVSPDGKRAVTASEDRSVRLWDLARLGQVSALEGHAAPVTGVAFSPDGSRLATVSSDGVARLWSLPAIKQEANFPAHAEGVVRIAMTADGQQVVTGGGDGKLSLWNAGNGAPLKSLNVGETILALAVTTDGRVAAVGTEGGRIQLWDLAGGVRLASLEGHEGAVSGIAFDERGETLISGGMDGSVRQWGVSDRRQIKELGKHEAAVTYITVGKDGTFALSSSEDGGTRLWNIPAGKQLVSLYSTETGWAVVDGQGRYDGNQGALAGIEWKGDDAALPIDNFAEGYYEAALLPRQLQADEELAKVRNVSEGVHYPPKVSFASPSVSGDVTERRVVVEVVAEEDGGGGVADVRLYRNGKLVPQSAATISKEEGSDGKRMVGRYEMDLSPGQTTFSATALNDEKLESPPRTVTLRAPGAPPVGAIHVLVVGINKYRNEKLNLNYAIADANAVASFFSSSGMAAARVAEVRMLSDDQATKENILAALTALRSVPPEDAVVLYMAGHGVSIGDDWYFVSHEIEHPNKREILTAQGLSSSEVKAAMESLAADRSLLLLDTCQSGTAVSPLKEYRGMKALRLMARSVGTHVLAATNQTQFAIELATLGHGIFTYALLSALTGTNGSKPIDGMVTASNVIGYVEDQVPRLSKEFADEAQHPTGYSRGADFAVSKPKK